MSASPDLNLFSEILRRMAAALMQSIRSNVTGEWQSAYLDVRGSTDGSSQSMKIRAIRPTGDVVSVKTNSMIEKIVGEVWRVKDEVFAPRWFGLLLDLSNSGECEVKFNYDPQCDEDDSFYDV